MSAPEEWRPVVGAERYEVSSLGAVRRYGGRPLKLRPHPRGYLIVDLSADGHVVSKTVHRLVATAFHGPALGRQVNHRDGVKHHNAAANLEWVSARDNTAHAIATGLRGARSPAPLSPGGAR